MNQPLEAIIDLQKYPLRDGNFRMRCQRALNKEGVLVMKEFVTPTALVAICNDGAAQQHLAFYAVDKHNIYLQPSNARYPVDHPRNSEVSSSKGCITTDQIPADSALHTLYEAAEFRRFLCAVLGEAELHAYADALSSINLHYASEGQELGWHFDNSSFAITLMIQEPENGGVFEYVKDVRDADRGETNYERSGKVLDGDIAANSLTMEAGTLVLFRGRNALHRVTPVVGARTRMLAVLAYNTEPGIALSESARMTFYGRLG